MSAAISGSESSSCSSTWTPKSSSRNCRVLKKPTTDAFGEAELPTLSD
jgi:hypothetical protein